MDDDDDDDVAVLHNRLQVKGKMSCIEVELSMNQACVSLTVILI